MNTYLYPMLLRLRLISLILCLCLSIPAIATPTVHKGTKPAWVVNAQPNDKLLELKEVNDGYYIQFFEEELNVEKDEIYHHLIRSIISNEGVQAASNISIDFNPDYEQLSFDKIIVWRDGKPIDKLNKSAFKVVASEQDLSMFIYNGNYSAYLILDDIRKGDRIEYSYTLTGSNPIYCKKFFFNFYEQSQDPIGCLHYYITCPKNRNLNFRYFNNATEPTKTEIGNNTIYEWSLTNIKGVKLNANSPAWFNPFQHVQISEYKDWGEVIDWAYKINTPEEKLGGNLGKRLAELEGKYHNNDSGLFRAIVDIVQNEVRYMGVEIGTYSQKANSPEKVYNQRYGDCKDKALLLVSMLRSVGIKADMAYVNTIKRKHIEEDYPSPNSFNHSIAVAHLYNKDIWVDATHSNQGGSGINIYCPDYGSAMVLHPPSNNLTIIPQQNQGKIQYFEDYETNDLAKPVSFTVRTIYTLSKADEIRNTLANSSTSEIESDYIDYYSKIYPHLEKGDSIQIIDNKQENRFETIEKYIIPGFFEYDSVNKNYVVEFYASMISNMLPLVEHNQQFPISLKYPYDLEYSVNLHAPMNWHVGRTTDDISRNAYHLSRTITTAGDVLTLKYEFSLLKNNIPKEEIAQYEKDRKKITSDYLSYSFTHTPDLQVEESDTNAFAWIMAIITIGLCITFGLRIYKTYTVNELYPRYAPKPLGGWLIVSLMAISILAIILFTFLTQSKLYDNNFWHIYDKQYISLIYKVLCMGELITNTFMFSLAAFCLILFMKRRDILPKYVIILYISVFTIILLENTLEYMIIPGQNFSYIDIAINFISCCIWIPYYMKSSRVRDTFIVTYPE